jgi:putative peptidoglycan lipid II flippase
MLLLVLRIPMVRLVYGAADFPWSATLLTGKVVAILAVSLFAEASIHILSRSYYALHNTKLPLVFALIAVTTNIIISTLSTFVYSWGVMGLAVGFSLSAVLEMMLLIIFLIPKLKSFKLLEFILSPLKMLFAAEVMALGLWVPMRLLDKYVFDTTRVVPLIILTLIVCTVGGSVYIFLTYLMKVPELKAYLTIFKKLGNWRAVLGKTEEVIEEAPNSQPSATMGG